MSMCILPIPDEPLPLAFSLLWVRSEEADHWMAPCTCQEHGDANRASAYPRGHRPGSCIPRGQLFAARQSDTSSPAPNFEV